MEFKNTHKTIKYFKTWLLILSMITVLALALSIISLSFSPSIGSENYIGIMTTFMGICVTLMFGFQIFNSIEYKTRLEKVEKLQVELKKEINKAVEEKTVNNYILQSAILQAEAMAVAEVEPYTTCFWMYKSLIEALNSNDVTTVANRLIKFETSINKLKCKIDNSKSTHIKLKQTGLIYLNKISVEDFKQYPLFQIIESKLKLLLTELDQCLKKG